MLSLWDAKAIIWGFALDYHLQPANLMCDFDGMLNKSFQSFFVDSN